MTFSLYTILAKQSLKEFTTYRMTSIMVVIFGFMFTLIEVIAGAVYYSFNNTIGGFSFEQYELMIVSLASITYTYQFLFIGAHEALAEDIIEGDLDYIFLRPINSYFYYALRRLDFPSLINLIVYIPVSIYLLIKFDLTPLDWLLVALFYVVGVLFVFAMNQLVIEVSFWKDNMTALNGVPEYLIDSANRPAKIYPKFIRMFLVNVIPVLALSNGIVNLTHVHIHSALSLLLPLLVMTILLLIGSYYIWNIGLKRYSSAS
ncbi:ABC-2 family transporter protein [Weissella minor]|uniref:ABC transporter permease n=1 Tax=Weissella minor TaxID=1620 RepID=A0A0R2JHM1_9LACO|nr:ABC-2 family transporter protein [Weissella minor]KRN76816.1 ABC transporter permease [Weissella minor]